MRRSQRIRAHSHSPLLDALPPVLSAFHSFLSSDDAVRLLRTSRTAALALLPGYSFTCHTFQPTCLVTLRRLRDLCALYHLRVTQLALPESITELTFDAAPPHLSPIPASVTALSLGPVHSHPRFEHPRWAALSAAASDWQDREPWRLPDPHTSLESLGEAEEQRQLTGWVSDVDRVRYPAPWCDDSVGCFNRPLAPGLLPSGLRVLLLHHTYNQPLRPDCLPSSLTFLQLGYYFNLPIAPSSLPASLLQLSVEGPMYDHHQSLLPSLPASLQRLRLNFWPHALQAEGWPAGLKALHLSQLHRPLQPHVLPSTLLYLSLNYVQHPLLPDVFPSSLVELHLGKDCYNHPLTPGVLPSSLRRLTLGGAFCQLLQVGSLPEGLLFLRFNPGPSILPALQPGVLPSTLLAVDFTNRYKNPLSAGVIPSSVRWVRLPRWYRDGCIEAVLPARAECAWFEVS